MRVWRNWQTRQLQVLVFARRCRFKSCYPHQQFQVQVQVLLPAPAVPTKSLIYGSIAQLGEHLPYKQRVIGSSPIVPIGA